MDTRWTYLARWPVIWNDVTSRLIERACCRATSRVFRGLAIRFALITRFIDAYRLGSRSTRAGSTRRVKIDVRPVNVAGADLTELTCNGLHIKFSPFTASSCNDAIHMAPMGIFRGYPGDPLFRTYFREYENDLKIKASCSV